MAATSEQQRPARSGLEIRDVYYRGKLVMKRGHAPMLNVEYNPGGCGCYRDWQDQEQSIRADHQITPPSSGYFEPTFPAETVCDHSTSNTSPVGDCPWGGSGPCNSGVAAEKYADHLVMSTQFAAGWYRYTMRWTFYLDGRIEPRWGFGTANTSCSTATHRHHVYWRFDFDIDGADGDSVNEGAQVFTTEAARTWGDGSVTWEVHDGTTGRGYRLVPGTNDVELPSDGYSKTDFMATLYHSGELQDNDQGLGDCAVEVEDLVNSESIQNADVVLYYRGGVQDVVNSNIYFCKTVGPTLVPLGDWGAGNIFGDGFETGDASAWSGAVP
ncbi:MAG: hypothetical protein HC897_02085 [Thermoanaerobaculia bacterium]|nr:hypothetical protein [Thermoanaerobaculia bacterium]